MTHQSVADDQYGQLWRRLKEIARRVDEGSIPLDKTMSGLQLIIEGEFEASTSATTTYPVTVNYALSIEEMIAAGLYDWKNNDITAKHFPVKGEGVVDVEIQLVHFDRVVESEEALRELNKMSLRPATLEELLAFGAEYPELQRQFPIVALGSVWRRLGGDRDVPYLYGFGRGRGLDLDVFEGRWYERCRFVAVRK